MSAMVTGETITDEEIRALMNEADNLPRHCLCEAALSNAFNRTQARARCAAILNERARAARGGGE